MKRIYIFIALLSAGLLAGCAKDPFDGVKSNERAIEAITLGGGLIQVGPATIDRASAKASVKVLVQDNTDLSKVIANIQTSYKATVSPANGQPIDFAANNNSFKYTVKSQEGETREWTVEIVPFTETLLGTYTIQQLVVYGGTGPEYGGGAVIKMSDKPWDWSTTDGPDKELDNEITFEYTGVTSDGKTTGTVTNNAGADGTYANFVFKTPSTDVNNFYRTIPKGTSTWERDYAANTVSFITAEGKKTTATFEGASTIDLGNGFSKTITDNSFDFTLSGVDDWTNIYSDLDKFVKNPHRYWIDVKRKP
ncbi:hypothetical protein GA0116948_108171 [Chitinophaga costaii]|uniref:DUF5018 domain-containing protein n=1 Tax=Chitinophaga costaii TaxID=1335309 RepID=A0A1C4EK00_9BACT|nr:hypothetical protein [Chitinophaga costaii]PUZ23771.1 hypothetical protein DCM91_13305 [Chitinophaga costaii]SCC43822.1 hypothetical protein GA0116948_108171 [Chitinophaga costaii]